MILIIPAIYYIPALLYVLVWSVRIRQKQNLTQMDRLGEAIIYALTSVFGLFIVFMLKPKYVKKRILP